MNKRQAKKKRKEDEYYHNAWKEIWSLCDGITEDEDEFIDGKIVEEEFYYDTHKKKYRARSREYTIVG